MKKSLYFILTLTFLIVWSSCRKDFDLAPSTGNLQFSRDTVYLDTVFTNIGSSTYNLKVYNRSSNDISIPTIRLGQGEASEYRLNVDGLPGKSFNNIQILAEDSIFIFVETTIDINNLPNTNGEFLYTDAIEFDTGSNLQKVELVTLVKDATFIFPTREGTGSNAIIETLTLNIDGDQVETEIQGRYLEPDELTFTNEKPYVIYGYAAVGANDVLTVEAGARVHFHANSGLIITDQASLKVNGALSTDTELLENEVIFEGDRLEPSFAEVPGQWGTIWLFQGSIDNDINYATIKNATVGIVSDSDANATEDKLEISNSQIYNSSNFGILGRATSISGQNLVINNSGQSSFAGTIGGKYNFTHCTIANYWNNSFRQFPALLLNNFVIDQDNVATVNDLTEANFTNCIIYGNEQIEFSLEALNDAAFNFNFSNSLIRFNDPNGNFDNDFNYDFSNSTLYNNVLLQANPNFKDPFENLMMIGDDNEIEGLANPTGATLVPLDLIGTNRTTNPDAGAYQSVIFED